MVVPDGSAGDGGDRVVVIGLDGADFRFLDRFELPAIDRLRSRGVEAPLHSTHPPWTASAWPSAYTGRPPAEHGVFGPFTYERNDPEASKVVDRSDVVAPALWDYCTAAGVPSVVLNVPVTHPAGEMEGVLVPGYFAPPGSPGHPEGIREELGEDYRIYPAAGTDDPDAGTFEAAVETRARAAVELMSTREWRVALLQVQSTDAVAHDCGDGASIRRVYRAADRFVERVLEVVPAGTGVVLCSDHGIGPADGYEVCVNELLRDRGLLVGSGEPPGIGTDGGSSSLSRLGAAAVARAGRSVLDRVGVCGGRVPPPVRWLGDAALGTGTDAVRAVEGVDWQESRAYCRVGSEAGVRINLASRDPGGVVPGSPYERTRDRVIAALRSLETPDGAPAFATVERYEDHTGVAPSGDAFDVVFLPAEGNAASAKLTGRRMVPIDTYDHRPEGVFVAAGGPFAGGVDPDRASITDLVAIALAGAGLPVPARIEGSVPEGLVDGIRRQAYDGVDFGRESSGSSETVRRRLDDLGYV
jgi:predicted AlkP superfamily phosphohydrolase/phosphomutase